MNPDIFAEWLRRQNYRVLRTNSSYWVEAGPRIYQAFPYHWIISPLQEETTKLMQDQKAIALRYSTSINADEGCLSYHVVYERGESGYTLQNLPKKARYDVKKGLSNASVEQISFSRLATEGWNLRRETLIRQGRSKAETERWWRKLCLSTEDLPGFETWGAIANGKLVAALLAFSCDEYFSILYHQSLTEFLHLGVNNALAFVVTSHVLNRPGQQHLFYGLHSLDAPASVDQFKFRMGYTAKPVRQRVVFHPWFRPFVNKVSHAVLHAGHEILPNNGAISKAEGMFRFFLQGGMPLSKQTQPAPLQGTNA